MKHNSLRSQKILEYLAERAEDGDEFTYFDIQEYLESIEMNYGGGERGSLRSISSAICRLDGSLAEKGLAVAFVGRDRMFSTGKARNKYKVMQEQSV